MNNTEDVINRLNLYLSLTRFNYTTQEQLSRLSILRDYYKVMAELPSGEKLQTRIQFAEQLSGKLKLPLKVRGVFLTVGRPKAKYYLAEELEAAARNPVNQKFPIMLDHRDKEAGQIVGVVTKIQYNQAGEALSWWGHINDETFARNVIDSVITDVSATVYSSADYSEEYGLTGRDLTFGELSLVLKGADKGNYIEIDEDE